MKKLFTLILLTILACGAGAQVPGYLGKRFYVKYNFDFQPNIVERIDPAGRNNYDLFDMRHTAGVEYVVNKRLVVGLSYHFMKSSVNFTEGEDYDYYYNEDFRSAAGYVQTHGIRLDTKLFRVRRGHLAPRGPFWQFGLSVIRFDSGLKVAAEERYWPSSFRSGFDVVPHVGWGRQFVIAKRVIIEYGCEAGLPFGALLRNGITPLGVGMMVSSTGNTDTQDDTNWKLMNMYMFQIRLGVGFLAF